MNTRAAALILLVVLPACAGLYPYVDGVESDAREWTRYQTRAVGSVVAYSLPRFGRLYVYPRSQANPAPKDNSEQTFAGMPYGTRASAFSHTEVQLFLELRPVGPDAIEPDWTPQQFAEFYWREVEAAGLLAKPSLPHFPPNAEHEVVELGDGAWYHLAFRALDDQREPYAADIYLRPLSSSHVLGVTARYLFYEQLPLDLIARRREFVRKVVELIRIDPTPEAEAELRSRASSPTP